MLEQIKVCISILSCVLILFFSCFESPASVWGTGGANRSIFHEDCITLTIVVAGIFLCLLMKFSQAYFSRWNSLWAFKVSASLPYLKSYLINSYLLPFSACILKRTLGK